MNTKSELVEDVDMTDLTLEQVIASMRRHAETKCEILPAALLMWADQLEALLPMLEQAEGKADAYLFTVKSTTASGSKVCREFAAIDWSEGHDPDYPENKLISKEPLYKAPRPNVAAQPRVFTDEECKLFLQLQSIAGVRRMFESLALPAPVQKAASVQEAVTPTCAKCGRAMRFNVPRLGPNGGFVHSETGDFLCTTPQPAPVQTMEASAKLIDVMCDAYDKVTPLDPCCDGVGMRAAHKAMTEFKESSDAVPLTKYQYKSQP